MADISTVAVDLKFDILRDAIYHAARCQFLDTVNRFVIFLSVIFGTSAATGIGGASHVAQGVLAALAALSSTFSLVGNFGVSARKHAFLQRRCYEMLAKVERLDLSAGNAMSVLVDVRTELTTLYGEEPPQMRALDAIAYNAACGSMGKSKGRLKIRWWQSLLRHFFPFYGTDFRPINQTT